MRSQLEYTIKDEVGELVEEDIAPVPSVILDYIVSLGFDPEVEDNQGNAANPSTLCTALVSSGVVRINRAYLMMWTGSDSPSGTRKDEKANIQYAKKSLQVY